MGGNFLALFLYIGFILSEYIQYLKNPLPTLYLKCMVGRMSRDEM